MNSSRCVKVNCEDEAIILVSLATETDSAIVMCRSHAIEFNASRVFATPPVSGAKVSILNDRTGREWHAEFVSVEPWTLRQYPPSWIVLQRNGLRVSVPCDSVAVA